MEQYEFLLQLLNAEWEIHLHNYPRQEFSRLLFSIHSRMWEILWTVADYIIIGTFIQNYISLFIINNMASL